MANYRPGLYDLLLERKERNKDQGVTNVTPVETVKNESPPVEEPVLSSETPIEATIVAVSPESRRIQVSLAQALSFLVTAVALIFIAYAIGVSQGRKTAKPSVWEDGDVASELSQEAKPSSDSDNRLGTKQAPGAVPAEKGVQTFFAVRAITYPKGRQQEARKVQEFLQRQFPGLPVVLLQLRDGDQIAVSLGRYATKEEAEKSGILKSVQGIAEVPSFKGERPFAGAVVQSFELE